MRSVREEMASKGSLKEFAELRHRFQKAIGAQARMRRTPELRFELDGVLRSAERIEQVLRGLDDV